MSLPSGASLWNGMLGRVKGQCTTICLLNNLDSPTPPFFILFQELPKKSFKKNQKFEKQNKNTGKHKDKSNFNFSEAKFEVQKLALNAYKGREKHQAMISYLVELGAQVSKKLSLC